MNKSKKLVVGLLCFLTLVTMCTMASAQYGTDDAASWALFGLGTTICIIIFALPFILGLLLGIWVYKDAEKRGASGVLWLLIVWFVVFPIGLIIWLVVRPPIGGAKKEPDRRCPNCGRAIPMDAKACPYCAKKFEE